jgi:hypothetical protein
LKWIANSWLDDENIDIRLPPLVPSGTGSKEHDSGLRRGRLDQTSAYLFDQGVIGHVA